MLVIAWKDGDFIPKLHHRNCQIWWAQISDLQPWHFHLLDEEERKKANSFHHAADRARFVIGCVISRLVLRKHLAVSPLQVPIDRTCPVCKLAHGRPQLPDGMPQLSVSHSGEYVVVAFTASAPVGIDIEQITPNIDVMNMATGVLTDTEMMHVMQLPDEKKIAGFLTYWTRKEAVLKATGEGLMISPTHLTVSAPNDAPKLLVFKEKSLLLENTVMREVQFGLGYIASLAVLNKEITEFQQRNARSLLYSYEEESLPIYKGSEK
ncbi:4'-phosphopantetheinyl transferase superfamily protein [Bacillus cytotoxicus]